MKVRVGLNAESINLDQIVADQAAYRDWCDAALPRVYRYVYARSGRDPDLAEELTQQTRAIGVIFSRLVVSNRAWAECLQISFGHRTGHVRPVATGNL